MNLLYNRLFVLFAGGEASKPYKLQNGVAQGSTLTPTLYYIYTYQISHHLLAKGNVC